jgi:hypothetical protein
MAAEDYVVADRPNAGLTAGEKVQETVFDNPDTEAQAEAASEGVSNAAFIGYAAALNTFQGREDIETLADRRARSQGDSFADGDFMRAEASDTPPTPGSVNGVAPSSS